MTIPEIRDADDCPPNRPACPHTVSINGSDSQGEVSHMPPEDIIISGPQRFIGIIIVASLVIILSAVWLLHRRWRQSRDSCCSRGDGDVGADKDKQRPIEGQVSPALCEQTTRKVNREAGGKMETETRRKSDTGRVHRQNSGADECVRHVPFKVCNKPTG